MKLKSLLKIVNLVYSAMLSSVLNVDTHPLNRRG